MSCPFLQSGCGALLLGDVLVIGSQPGLFVLIFFGRYGLLSFLIMAFQAADMLYVYLVRV